MISLFTPTHESSFLPEIYKCLKRQTFKDWQWVIVYNNGGKEIGFKDKRIKETTLQYRTNEWVGPMKHLACTHCDGDILLEMDHDDLLTDDALAEVDKAFRDKAVGFVYSNTVHATADYKPVMRFDERYGWKYRKVKFRGHELDEHFSFPPRPDSISKIWFAPNHLRAFRRSVYEQVGGYNPEMRILDDLDLMCKMYLVTKFKHINKGLYIYRVHGKNTWLRYNQEIQENVYRIHDRYIEDLARRWCVMNNLRMVELGGGIEPCEGFETVDLKDADIILDLDNDWDFPDNSIGMVKAIDLFEHLKDPIHTMKELYRVLAPGGWAFIKVPSTDGRGAFQDPTHKSFWNENSFHYYTKAKLARYIGTPVRFQAARLYTTEPNEDKVCWTIAHLVSLKDGFRPAGMIEI
jgi:SAM-dependent methyltransferase